MLNLLSTTGVAIGLGYQGLIGATSVTARNYDSERLRNQKLFVRGSVFNAIFLYQYHFETVVRCELTLEGAARFGE